MLSSDVVEHLRKSVKLAQELRDSGAGCEEYMEKLDLDNLVSIMGEHRFELQERLYSCSPSSEEHKEMREDILNAYRSLDQEEREIRRLFMMLKNINDSYSNPGPEEKEWYKGWTELLNK
jgi:hypothetical protein